jgi:tRNA pseudouridine55 synthase
VGVLNVNKPGGWTSHDVVARVRRLAGERRVGHAGTLDPLATGVLPVLLGRATRLAELVQSGRKQYAAVVQLGAATSTDDAEGQVIASAPVPRLTAASVEAALQSFRGDILQTPPAFSAIKVAGQRAYKAARQGAEVALAPRLVTIYEAHALLLDPTSLQLEITCGSGTYIRAVARDLAVALDTVGHLKSLVRTRVGPFCLSDALRLEDIAARGIPACVQPANAVLPDAQALDVTFEDAERLCNGSAIETALPAADYAWVYDPRHTLVCLGRSDGNLLRSRVLL